MKALYIARQSRQHQNIEEYFIIQDDYALGRSRSLSGSIRGYWFTGNKETIQSMSERVKSANHSRLKIFSTDVTLDDKTVFRAIELGMKIPDPTQYLISENDEYGILANELFQYAAQQIFQKMR